MKERYEVIKKLYPNYLILLIKNNKYYTFDEDKLIFNYLKRKLPEEIKLKHGDFETTISLSQIDAEFDTKSAVIDAYSVGRQGNIFQNNLHPNSLKINQ